MFRLLLFISIIATCAASAQNGLRNSFSRYDSCPDPVKYKIASRTIYRTCPGETNDCGEDTCIERYDRSGKLSALIYREPDLHITGGVSNEAHYFAYDTQGWIILDSSIHNKSRSFSTYEHFPRSRRTVIHKDVNGIRSTITVYYDKTAREIARYEVNVNGDTVLRSVTNGDTTITASYLAVDHSLVLQDSISVIRSGNKVATFRIAPLLEGHTGSIEVQVYDSISRVTDKLEYADRHAQVLAYSRHYDYDSAGHLIRETRTRFPYKRQGADTNITVWKTEYSYNKSGRRTQSRMWKESAPSIVYINTYVYDEKGLQTENIYSLKIANAPEKVEFVERWVYEYY